MKKTTINFTLLGGAVLVMLLSIWGPEILAKYKDRMVLDHIKTKEVEAEGAGYRYTLSGNEKLYILSQALISQTVPESEQNALTKVESGNTDFSDLEGTYAFVVNRKGPTGKEITGEEIFSTCNEMLADLKEMGILPEEVKEVDGTNYEAILYSAIDVLEPRNNVAVWQVSLLTNKQNADKSNRLLDAYLDADDGKVYEFYVRTQLKWEEIDPDAIIERWSSYMGFETPEEYETDNPLLESTPYYKKYIVPGMGEERTIVTVGFYEGINELFLKISR